MASRGSDTANHKNHVHITVYAKGYWADLAPDCTKALGMAPGASRPRGGRIRRV